MVIETNLTLSAYGSGKKLSPAYLFACFKPQMYCLLREDECL